MEMICENAGKCLESNCPEKKRHETDGRCVKECFICGGIKGSKCIPYVELANIGTKEEPKLLTDHAKYCRLSKQPGGLCACKNEVVNSCEVLEVQYVHSIRISKFDTVCPRPEKQQPVKLPKDPLEELICGYTEIVYNYVDEAFTQSDVEKTLREFAEKVRAL